MGRSMLTRSVRPLATTLLTSVLVIATAGYAEGSERNSCDLARGQTICQCAACHLHDSSGKHSTGPNLFNVVDSKVGSKSGYPYSQALSKYFDYWTSDALNRFLANPTSSAPGTTMAFAGLKKAEDREAVICFLSKSGQ